MTEEQRRIADEWMGEWLSILPERYGFVDRFNHGYAANGAPTGGRTLEIGAGLGEHLRYESLEGREYHTVELRPELAQEIQRRFPEVHVTVADCQKRLPFEDGYFDCVLAIHVLEHLPNLPAALAEIHRVLHPRGCLKALIPCEGGILHTLGRRLTAQRVFERRYNMSYEWFVRSEHVSLPWEIIHELGLRFRLIDRTYFPLRIPSVHANLMLGLTGEPLQLP